MEMQVECTVGGCHPTVTRVVRSDRHDPCGQQVVVPVKNVIGAVADRRVTRNTEKLLRLTVLYILTTMSADKRIPVTEETRKELHDLKEPGQTYDELLVELAQLRRRQELADRFREMDESREEFVALEDV